MKITLPAYLCLHRFDCKLKLTTIPPFASIYLYPSQDCSLISCFKGQIIFTNLHKNRIILVNEKCYLLNYFVRIIIIRCPLKALIHNFRSFTISFFISVLLMSQLILSCNVFLLILCYFHCFSHFQISTNGHPRRRTIVLLLAFHIPILSHSVSSNHIFYSLDTQPFQ